MREPFHTHKKGPPEYAKELSPTTTCVRLGGLAPAWGARPPPGPGRAEGPAGAPHFMKSPNATQNEVENDRPPTSETTRVR